MYWACREVFLVQFFIFLNSLRHLAWHWSFRVFLHFSPVGRFWKRPFCWRCFLAFWLSQALRACLISVLLLKTLSSHSPFRTFRVLVCVRSKCFEFITDIVRNRKRKNGEPSFFSIAVWSVTFKFEIFIKFSNGRRRRFEFGSMNQNTNMLSEAFLSRSW